MRIEPISVPIFAGLPHGAIDPARNPATRDFSLPPRVGGGIESLSRLRALVDPHELGDRLGVAGDHDLLLDLQARLGFGPSTQVADAESFSPSEHILFHGGRRRVSARGVRQSS
jgi:hypothetical protein